MDLLGGNGQKLWLILLIRSVEGGNIDQKVLQNCVIYLVWTYDYYFISLFAFLPYCIDFQYLKKTQKSLSIHISEWKKCGGRPDKLLLYGRIGLLELRSYTNHCWKNMCWCQNFGNLNQILECFNCNFSYIFYTIWAFHLSHQTRCYIRLRLWFVCVHQMCPGQLSPQIIFILFESMIRLWARREAGTIQPGYLQSWKGQIQIMPPKNFLPNG